MGAKARQGPHQAAQKSTKTGVSDFKTSWSKLVSVTSKIELLAIIPPVYIAPPRLLTLMAFLRQRISMNAPPDGGLNYVNTCIGCGIVREVAKQREGTTFSRAAKVLKTGRASAPES